MSLSGQWLHWPVWNVPRGTLPKGAIGSADDDNATAAARSDAETDAERIISNRHPLPGDKKRDVPDVPFFIDRISKIVIDWRRNKCAPPRGQSRPNVRQTSAKHC
jgi:hypothetical protein